MQQCSSTSCVRTDSRTPRPVRHRAVRLQHTTNKIQRAGRSAAEQQAPGMPPRNTHTHTSCSLRSFISMLLYAPWGSITHSDECIICPVSQVWAHIWPGLASGVVTTHSIPENRNMDYSVMVFSNRSTPLLYHYQLCCDFPVTHVTVFVSSHYHICLLCAATRSVSLCFYKISASPCVTAISIPPVFLPDLCPLCQYPMCFPYGHGSSLICIPFITTKLSSLHYAYLVVALFPLD